MITFNDLPKGPWTPANSLARLNDLIAMVNDLQRRLGELQGHGGADDRRAGVPDMFLGYTTTAPPNVSPGDAPPLDDARYYVVRCVAPDPAGSAPTYGPLGFLSDNLSVDDDPFNGKVSLPQFVVATNLAETGRGVTDTSGSPGTHLLPDNTIVLCIGIPSRQNPVQRVYILAPVLGSAAFPVRVKKDGGVAGSMASSTSCTFTYSLFDLAGNALKDSGGTAITGKTPDAPRYSNCAYTAPADLTIGLAYTDENGQIQLMWAVKERVTTATISVYEDSIDGSGNLIKTPTPILVLDKGVAGSPTTIVPGCS